MNNIRLKMIKRKISNGPLVFKKGTEKELLNYVLKNSEDNPNSVIEKIDEFCWKNHWMMHVGDQKGKVLDKYINQIAPKHVLELGTYCGYSAIRMARHLDNGVVYSIEADENNVEISKRMINKARLNDKIFISKGFSQDIIPTLKRTNVQFELVFFDHAKDRYYEDLLLLRKYDLLSPDVCLIADNVIIFKIDDYLSYVRDSKNCKSSKLYSTNLEYNNEQDKMTYKDGVEVSFLY